MRLHSDIGIRLASPGRQAVCPLRKVAERRLTISQDADCFMPLTIAPVFLSLLSPWLQTD